MADKIGKKHADSLKIKLMVTLTLLVIITISTVTLNTVWVTAQNNELTVTKTVDPTTIWFDRGSPEPFMVQINVTGYGGIIEETLPIDVVYAIDSSDSMFWNDYFNLRLDAAKNFTDLLDSTRDQAGVISWNLEVDFTYGLTNDFTTLKTLINGVNATGGTDLDLALSQAISMLDANTRVEDSVKVIIVLSDGEVTPEVGAYTPHGSLGSYTDEAASRGYRIFSIGLMDDVGEQEFVAVGVGEDIFEENGFGEENLMDMAQWTGGVYYSSPTMENLEAIFNEIYETIVMDTSPYEVDIVEVTETYIVNEGSFNIAPDSVVEVAGKTEITWLNVAQYVGNHDTRLSADETFSVTFSANLADEPITEIFFVAVEHGVDNSTWVYDVHINGGHYPEDRYPVDVEGEAVINYYDYEETPQTVDIPQVYIIINESPSYWTLAWCGGDVSITLTSHSYTYGYDENTGIHGIRFEYPSDQKGTTVRYWFTLVGDYDRDTVNVGIVRGIGDATPYFSSVDGPVWTYNVALEYVIEGLDPTETYLMANATTDVSESHGYGASSVTFQWYGPFKTAQAIPNADPEKLKANWTHIDSDGSDGFTCQTSHLLAEDVGVWYVTAKFNGGLHRGEAINIIGVTVLSCSVSPSDVSLGESITVSGAISPAISNATVTLTYVKPDGSTVMRTSSTNLGDYHEVYLPDMLGLWRVSASWDGDATHEGASSAEVMFTVSKRPTILSCSVSPSDVSLGESVTISGSISPSVSDVMVMLTYMKPDNSTVMRTVMTYPDGKFIDLYTPDLIGTWKVTASWDGDSIHKDSAFQHFFQTHEKLSMQDDTISFSLIIDEQNIIDAQNESDPIVLNADEVTLFLEWINTGTSSLKLHQLELGFTFLDLTVYSLTYELGNIISPSSTGNYTFTLDFGPILKPAGVNLVSGIYKVTCKLIYETVQTTDPTHEVSMVSYKEMETSIPPSILSYATAQTVDSIHEVDTNFYMKMESNMLTSVLGIAVTAGTALSIVTALGATREVTTAIQTVRSISSAADINQLLGLKSLPNGLNILPSGQSEWVKVGDLPKETIKRMYESAKKHWDGKKCPKCKAKWAKNAPKCVKCGISLEEAEKLHSETVVKLTEKAKMPIYKTAGGVGVKVLARMMGLDTMIVNAVLKTMLDSGLAKSKVSRRFILNKFIVNGSKLIVSAIIFLQIAGLKVFGGYYLIFAIILGATISFVVGTLVNRMLKY
jgi:Ca-activated chloride channel family protein